MKHIALLLMCVVVLPTVVAAQAGAWKIVEDQNGRVSQPSLYVFTARHFSASQPSRTNRRPPLRTCSPGRRWTAPRRKRA